MPPRTCRRRSQRIFMCARVIVCGVDQDLNAFCEDTETIAVNCHGALVLIAAPLELGQPLRISRHATDEEIVGRVAYIGTKQAGKTKVGIHFQTAFPGFWRIAFPPDNWLRASRQAEN